MKQITIIITALNEGNEPLKTIESIYATANPDLFRIILFNDGSKDWVDIPEKYKEVEVLYNKKRKGAPYCFDMGVKLSDTPYVFICNARMRFEKPWIEEGIEHLKKEPKTLFCTTSVAYKEGEENPIGKRYGARILDHSKDHSILEPEWLKAKKSDCYDIPCVLGANYFITKKWYRHIEGFKHLSFYGGMCAYLSLKSWAFGGKVKLIKSIEIGNVYREVKPYHDVIEELVWNKVVTAFLLLPWSMAYSLLHQIKYHDLHKKYYESIKNRIIKDIFWILDTRNHYKKKTTNNIEHLIIKGGN